MHDKRRLPRYSYQTVITIEQAGILIARGSTVDINTQAVQAIFDHRLPDMESFMLLLQLPDRQRLSCPASIGWITEELPDKWRAALYFHNLDSNAHKAIVDFGGQNWLREHERHLLN